MAEADRNDAPPADKLASELDGHTASSERSQGGPAGEEGARQNHQPDAAVRSDQPDCQKNEREEIDGVVPAHPDHQMPTGSSARLVDEACAASAVGDDGRIETLAGAAATAGSNSEALPPNDGVLEPPERAAALLCEAPAAERGSDPPRNSETAAPSPGTSPREPPCPTAKGHRRSSIRPAPDWRPQSVSKPSSPMVVVFSGESAPPRPPWCDDEAPSRPSGMGISSPNHPEPFPFADDLPYDENVAPPQPEARKTIPPRGLGAGRQAKLSSSLLPRPPLLPRGLAESEIDSKQGRTSHAPAQACQSEPRVRPRSAIARPTLLILGAVGLIGLLAYAVLSGRFGRSSADSGEVAEHSAQPRMQTHPAPSPQLLQAPSAAVSNGSSEVAVASQEAHEVALGSVDAQATDQSRHVVLEVTPLDAKVVYKGVGQPGPPFEFEIPEGKQLAVEVARRGFITRRVVIDGSAPNMNVGLVRKSSGRTKPSVSQSAAPNRPTRAPATRRGQ